MTIPPSSTDPDLADLPDAEFARGFASWIDARVADLTDEIKQRSEEIKQLGELRRRLVEFGDRQEAADAGRD